MVRVQILLAPQQHRPLEEIARRDGKSISAVTRQIIDAGLERIENEAEVWKERSQLLSALRLHRQQQPFVYAGDLVNQARQEREEDGGNL